MGFLAEFAGTALLFLLVFGMSGTVEIKSLQKQMRNAKALCIGLAMQFVIMPAFGFLVVKILGLPEPVGIMILVITSSPGGSYSNWWCSLFNAELALSVTMTTLSTLLSVIMLPTNLILYTRWTYSSAVVKSLDWSALLVSLVTVISGIFGGLLASYIASRRKRTALFRTRSNRIGNLAGVLLITLSFAVSSTDHDTSLWDRDAKFYIGCSLPAIFGICMAVYLAIKAELEPPERVAVAVESCYQNTGIATSVALTLFHGGRLAKAISVPLYYGIVEAVLLAIFCLFSWKKGWTKAPANENLCVVLYHSYEVDDEELRREELAAAGGSSVTVPGPGVPDGMTDEAPKEGDKIESTYAPDAIVTAEEDGRVVLERNDAMQGNAAFTTTPPTKASRFSSSLGPSRIRQAMASVWHGYQPSASSSPKHASRGSSHKNATVAVELPPTNGRDAEESTSESHQHRQHHHDDRNDDNDTSPAEGKEII